MLVSEPTFAVRGNRITCSDGRWWELQESPEGKRNERRPNGTTYRTVRAIAGGVREYAPRVVDFAMTADLILAWQMAAAYAP